MTNKLFYENSYIDECEAQIVDVIEANGRIEVVLDATPFYPEGGGQPSDRGTIDDVNVSYVYEKDDIIYHVVDSKPDNKSVRCKVDFDRRFDHMQQHSGEHLLSGAFFKLYKAVNCGFHLGEDYVTIDMNLSEITEEMVRRVELEVNEYIFRNLEVYTYIINKEQCNKLPLRKEVKVDEDIRIVQMGDADYSACCGTHVLRTGEVGIVKITKVEKNKGMTRIYFKCGRRALGDYISKHLITQNLVKFFSVEEHNILGKVESQSDTIKELTRKLSDAKMALAAYDVQELKALAEEELIVKSYEDKDFEDIQIISAALEKEPYTVILATLKDNRVLMAKGGSYDLSCGKLFKELLPQFNGKGGGNDKKAQAAFSNGEDISNFIIQLKLRINK